MAMEMPIEATTANKIDFRSLLYATSSTYHQSRIPLPFGNPTSEEWTASTLYVEDSYIRAYHALIPKRTVEEEEAEEREWDSIVRKPHVRQALRRMAAEARQQYYAGETEEGGFGLE